MEFKLPDIGEGVHEGEVVKWLVKEGDSISVDQPIVEIMTDKATVEIPTSTAGTVTKIMAKEGEMVKVGQVIMTFEGGAAAAKAPAQTPKTASAPAPKMPAPAPKPVVAQAPAPIAPASSHMASPGNVLATPSTRRLAAGLSIDLTSIAGTGPNGRVTREDVQKASQMGSGAVAAAPGRSTVASTAVALSAPAHLARANTIPGQAETLVPFRGIRRKIAEAMTRSKSTIPEFVYVDECDVTELVSFRNEMKGLAEKKGVKLTYLPFIIKAMIRALKQFPTMNASLDEANGNIIIKNYFNIGIAVDTEQGLMVPNVKNADQKSILEIAAEISYLAEKARQGKLSLDEMQGGTITITNPGPIGGLITAPVINHPEVAIMGVHKIVKRPIVKDDKIVIGDMIYFSLAVDHRVVDGATAARFMNVILEYLSSPKKMMLDMM